jgi:hypothetical protein
VTDDQELAGTENWWGRAASTKTGTGHGSAGTVTDDQELAGTENWWGRAASTKTGTGHEVLGR